ncbi:ABC transporter substrate-binding protein [Streptomyces acidiscabies]|uniref:Extracellular solute-binding protein n=1 Tax=Streptomyces acidiscabies TaxID=42234 RepID=A0AAP6EHS6_9ACTN|nr:extracellular solute-binding protein [Streptomyces acidiscabies]MBP5941925.1 extracellular solute-binding protein [Streptomyces sp. LBUM 1476]MBZ3913375.1 extracellular solute-binding protein [Streptomyces acidiscabies]MDX2963199.1 extracellular solute-binding protein [Streptomyces acidiscabies]MDX3024350.1 extracellular solute-binding protein [Streptomyces acidiscabies]MDX3795252.1 extracellular solute-binding protein [Streptomyces acidiscabies]
MYEGTAKPWPVRALMIPLILLGAACSAPGSGAPAASTGDPAVSTSLGTGEVTLQMYAETGFPLAKALADEFTRQHPNVTFKVREDQFTVLVENAPRVLAGDNAPDIMRLPTMVDLVKDNLLKDLDPYFKAYGWDKFPASQLAQLRVDKAGQRGSGPLYGAGLGYSVTGVFYNKDLAKKAGMSGVPGSVAEFEALLGRAKQAGVQPIVQFNKNTAGINFPYQALQNQFTDPAAVNDWIFQKTGATFDTPASLKAAETIGKWARAGYFTKDANAMDYTTMVGDFTKGRGLFMFNGDWESANLDAKMPGNVGFFLFPAEKSGGRHVAMSSPNTFGIGARSKHPNEAAYFLNWLHTDAKARKILVDVGGSSPGGPADLAVPQAKAGTVLASTLAASQQLAAENGAVDFTANATGSIFASAITPELQKLIVGQQTPGGYVKAVQKEYAKELSR